MINDDSIAIAVITTVVLTGPSLWIQLRIIYRVQSFVNANYTNCQKNVPIDLANPAKVIASKAKQSDAKHRPEQS